MGNSRRACPIKLRGHKGTDKTQLKIPVKGIKNSMENLGYTTE